MLARSRLNIARNVSCPGPHARCAIGINQLVEKNLSFPRGPLCCVSTTNALAWNISIHSPRIVISIGVGVEFGSALVPDEAWLSITSSNVLLAPPIRICDAASAGNKAASSSGSILLATAAHGTEIDFNRIASRAKPTWVYPMIRLVIPTEANVASEVEGPALPSVDTPMLEQHWP